MDNRARPERAIRIHVAAFDWNCPQHIPQRWTLDELEHSPIGERVQSLLAENAALRKRLAELESGAAR
jgi:predicted pyridoxine 5'-phosphate oxidase superfamily flavin-nucleotide-binding protein